MTDLQDKVHQLPPPPPPPPPPPQHEFFLTWTLPKYISFLRIGGKVNTIISKVFQVVDYESKIRISKLNRVDFCGNLPYDISVNSRFFCCNWLENLLAGFCNWWWWFWSQASKIKNDGSNVALTYSKFNHFLAVISLKTITRGFLRSLKNLVYVHFPVKTRRFRSSKLENYYSIVWEITKNLITNLNSAIENPILHSHTWCFDRVLIIPYSFAWKIHKYT